MPPIEFDLGELSSEGLGQERKSEWPSVRPLDEGKAPIERLAPGSVTHKRVLTYLLERIRQSEAAMQKFYPRWRIAETKVQAYINLADHEKMLKQLRNDRGAEPAMLKLIVPYGYSTVSTIVTYLIHAFAGRNPMFQVGTYRDETAASARMMEIVLQYNADHTRLLRELFQFFQDAEIYGVAAIKTRWKNQTALRTVWKDNPVQGIAIPGQNLRVEKIQEREERLVYSGNECQTLDPFLFFPDPRVPMHKVNREGEYVFWREFHGKHTLKRLETSGALKWINHIGSIPVNPFNAGESLRGLKSLGEAFPADALASGSMAGQNYIQVDQGSIDIIPRELGLGESEDVEKWLFTIGNKTQIIGAERNEADHDMHPVAVSEPWALGHGFGEASGMDYLAPLQDSLSWMFNSHMDNVRAMLNNMMVVDPSMIEMQDLTRPGPGKTIRLKKAAQGRDVRTVLHQLNIQDVTRGHIGDMQVATRMADSLMAVNDNLRGQQTQGGRRSATEARGSMEAASSRLASHAKKHSSMGIVDLTEQMSLNIQQFLDQDFYIEISGEKGLRDHFRQGRVPQPQGAGQPGGSATRITPEMVVGDFHYPVHDGTLPLDRVALLDVWKELFTGVLADPVLRSQYDIQGILEMIADIGGAKGMKRFRMDIQEQDPTVINQAVQAGNVVPAGGVVPGAGGGGPAREPRL